MSDALKLFLTMVVKQSELCFVIYLDSQHVKHKGESGLHFMFYTQSAKRS